MAQSIIPGILSGDQLSKLVYGAIEHGVLWYTRDGEGRREGVMGIFFSPVCGLLKIQQENKKSQGL